MLRIPPLVCLGLLFLLPVPAARAWSPELRGDILAFYHDLNAPISTKTNDKDWAKVLKELDKLKAVDPHFVAGQEALPAQPELTSKD